MTLEERINEYKNDTLSLLEEIRIFEQNIYAYARDIETLNIKLQILRMDEKAKNAIEQS
jgi:hypothetical protein